MEKLSILRKCGLFDAKVPRYTSYPPANRFQTGEGGRRQEGWLRGISAEKPVSVYVHIPFCRRLCWFCACRTQGTKTLAPVESYVTDLMHELDAVADIMPKGVKMARLHLGGGTPTLLNAPLMDQLLVRIHSTFQRDSDFEFSIEIDPTEAEPDVLEVLSDWDMRRASVGVQDFNADVQAAIGREQSFELTLSVVNQLRTNGVSSLNVDMLYGLPFQSAHTLVETLDRVVSLRPDRLALYGYAHVPHMSKRQVMIPTDALPGAEKRFVMASIAGDRLRGLGYIACGIDHFALPSDSLARAAPQGQLRRNFQGYTDDPCDTLLGFGASAISKFREGYTQNAVATAAYRERIASHGLAGHRGYVLSDNDRLVADLIEAIMCYGQIDIDQVAARNPGSIERTVGLLGRLIDDYPTLLELCKTGVVLRPGMEAAARLIAAQIDRHIESHHVHSLAI